MACAYVYVIIITVISPGYLGREFAIGYDQHENFRDEIDE